jgi:hypothetical protein
LVLPVVPAEARRIGELAGLVEDVQGGAVWVSGQVTFSFAAGDRVGRRLAAVQLVRTRIASARDVASAFAVSETTLWRWVGAFNDTGVAALVPATTGPKGPFKLTAQLAERISAADAAGATLSEIAALAGVSTATVRVALGRVTPRRRTATDPASQADVVGDAAGRMDIGPEHVGEGDAEPADRSGADLVVLARPVARSAERVAARFGDLIEAPVVITEGAGLPLVGLLLALPGLAATGLLEVAQGVFAPMRKGFYGLRVTLLTGVFLALLREPRAEGATRLSPQDLGRVLGLDRAPEVKTLRRKLAELASHGHGAQLQAALGHHHLTHRPETTGFLYLDGHVRVYSGGRELPKTHIARMRIAGPATEETWVSDSDGDPVMVLTAAPSQSLAAELHRLLPDLRVLIGAHRRATVTFDRGGYSPTVFAEILDAGFDLLTYVKGPWARQPTTTFTEVQFTAPDGTAHRYQLAERPHPITVPARPATPSTPAVPARTLTLRLVVRRSPDGHQTPILTSRADLRAAEITWRMSNRWRQENYFKYAREHFALDALDSYAEGPADLTRQVPNPAKTAAKTQVTTARADLAAAHADLAAGIDDAAARARQPGSRGTATVPPTIAEAPRARHRQLDQATATSRATPSHLPLAQVRPGTRQLETERKLLTHAIRMSAYNSESALARLLAPHYARSDDEGRALLREAFTLPGDLQIVGDTLHVRLDPASAPRRSRAIAALCAQLTSTATRYPDTNLTLHYSVKGHPTPP